MERVWRWLMLALVVVEIVLVRAGVLDVATAVGVVVGIEALLLVVGGRQVVVAVRRYRRDREVGLDVWAALEEGLAVLLPRPVARVAAMEPRLWVCLWQWLSRRRRREDVEFSYHKRSPVGALLIVVVITAPVEVLLFELLVPWAWLRWLLVIASLYALVWCFGFYASLVVLRHRMDATGLWVRYGLLGEGYVRYDQIAGMALERRRALGGRDGLRLAAEEQAGYFAIGGRTDLTLRLSAPCDVRGVLGGATPVSTVHLAADEPERLASALRGRTAVGAGSEGG